MTTPHRPRVLVVDDTRANIAILVGALRQKYRLGVAMDGQAALDDLARNPADLVLLDIMMPVMDGYEVLRRMKAAAGLERIPVIFITAMTEIESKAKGFELGAVDYVTKPFEVAEVRARVRTHLRLEAYRLDVERKNRELARLNEQLDRRLREVEALDRLVRARMSVDSGAQACAEIVAAVEDLALGMPTAVLRPNSEQSALDVVAASEADAWPGAVPRDAGHPAAAAWGALAEQNDPEVGIAVPLVCAQRCFGVIWGRPAAAALEGDTVRQGLRRLGAEAALLLQATDLIESLAAGGMDLEGLLNGEGMAVAARG